MRHLVAVVNVWERGRKIVASEASTRILLDFSTLFCNCIVLFAFNSRAHQLLVGSALRWAVSQLRSSAESFVKMIPERSKTGRRQTSQNQARVVSQATRARLVVAFVGGERRSAFF